MATVYRKTYTKPLPANAETYVRKGATFARWKDAKGKTRTAKLTTGQDGSERIIVEAGTFTAKYRDGAGIVREVATGCRDETAARSVLADFERRAELVKSKVVTATEADIADHQAISLAEHVENTWPTWGARWFGAGRFRNAMSATCGAICGGSYRSAGLTI